MSGGTPFIGQVSWCPSHTAFSSERAEVRPCVAATSLVADSCLNFLCQIRCDGGQAMLLRGMVGCFAQHLCGVLPLYNRRTAWHEVTTLQSLRHVGRLLDWGP